MDQERIQELRMEIIQELADLEWERDKEVNKLRRKSRQTISIYNFTELEDIYIRVRDIHSRFNSKIDDWTELLDTDQEGDPVFPERGFPESRYSPDNEDLSRKTSQMEEILITTWDVSHYLLRAQNFPQSM